MPRRAGLARDGRRHPLDERHIPRRGERDRLRKHRRPLARQPVHRLVEGNDGNAEPSPLDEEALDGVDPFRVRPCNRGRRPLRLALLAQGRPSLCRRGNLQAEDAVRIVVRGVVEVPRQHEDLPELLLERHSCEQVGHALGNRQLRVAIGRWLPRSEGQRRSQGGHPQHDASCHPAQYATR